MARKNKQICVSTSWYGDWRFDFAGGFYKSKGGIIRPYDSLVCVCDSRYLGLKIRAKHPSKDSGHQKFFTVEVVETKDGPFKADLFYDVWTVVGVANGTVYIPASRVPYLPSSFTLELTPCKPSVLTGRFAWLRKFINGYW